MAFTQNIGLTGLFVSGLAMAFLAGGCQTSDSNAAANGDPSQQRPTVVEMFEERTCTVMPAIVRTERGFTHDVPSAEYLASLINQETRSRAEVGTDKVVPNLTISVTESHGAQLRQELTRYVRANPPATDFVMFTEYVIIAEQASQIHYFVFDRQARLVRFFSADSRNTIPRGRNLSTPMECTRYVAEVLQTRRQIYRQ